MGLETQARDLFAELQEVICGALEKLDGQSRFREDRWDHRSGDDPPTGGGGGVTRVLAGGKVFEKAGVNLADVQGRLSERLAARLKVAPQPFGAM